MPDECPQLPPHYCLELDSDLLILGRCDGSVVAAFSARGVDPEEVRRAAEEDAEGQA